MILIAAWFFAMGMPVWLAIIFAIVIVFSIPFFISKKENDEKKKKKEEADAIKSTDEYQICVSKYDELLKKYKESKYYFNDMDGTNYAIFDNNIHIISALNDEYFVNIVKNLRQAYTKRPQKGREFSLHTLPPCSLFHILYLV